MAYFTWRSFDVGTDLRVERHPGLDPPGPGHLRDHSARRSSSSRASSRRLFGLPLEDLEHAGRRSRRIARTRTPGPHADRRRHHVRRAVRVPGGRPVDRLDARGDRHDPAGAVSRHPARQAARAVCLEHPDHPGAAGAAAVHPDGRDPVPDAPVAIAVQGPGAVGGAAAGPPAARQRHRLLDLRRHLGLVGRDHAGGRPHLARRAPEARLFEGRRGGLARRVRHARLPDPALEHHDHLRRAGRRLDRQAVHRGFHSGLPAGWLLHGLDHDPHGASSRPWCRKASARCASRRAAEYLALDQRARARGVPDPVRAGLDVWRPRDAVRSGGSRRAGRADRGATAGRARTGRRCGRSASARSRPAR